ncbi:MAG: hypothetical protein LBK68_03590 [Candidatus Margulisbacteria bacterium]|jgi:hypothetical protein|nr:hypothetical protein [Candidatus Margulisiibacteriota bacterium]
MRKLLKRLLKLKARDEILLRHITSGKIGCGPHKNKTKYDRQRSKLETKNAAVEE